MGIISKRKRHVEDSNSSSDDDDGFDITSNIGLNTADSSDESESSGDDEEEVQDIVDFSDEEDTKKKPKSSNKTLTDNNSFPSLEISDDEDSNNKGDHEDDDDDLNDYFSINNSEKSKHKKGSFPSFGFSKLILSNVHKKGFRQPTPIQRKTIPLILQKRDIVGMARTGSGKTAAFVLPMIEKLKSHSSKIGARAVILSPSRELALQTHRVFKEFSKGTHLRSVLLTGGDSLEDQFSMMMSNPDVIVATPGRFLHLKVEMSLDLKTVEYVVFDEADRLFEMGFQEQLNELLAALPMNRQTLLFSATLPSSLVDFAKAGLTNPVLVRLDAETKISENLEILFLSTKNEERENNLLYLLQDVIKIPLGTDDQIKKLSDFNKSLSDSDSEDEDNKGKQNSRKSKKGKFQKLKVSASNELPTEKSTIVFAPTRHHVEYITQLLKDSGFLVSYLYGTLDQHARKRQLLNFRAGLTSILVVTDVAARGVDIPMLANVINYSLPASSKIFIHRVGRTARAGNRGWAYSIVSETELPYMLDLELFLGKKILLTSMYEASCKLMKSKWIADGNTESSFEDPKISYTNRLVLGSAPRYDIESVGDLYKNIIESNFDLQMAKKVSLKAEKLYCRTRTAASPESIKRSKEVIASGWDEQNIRFGRNLEKEKLNFLAKFQNRRNKETVFEFGKNPNDDTAILMQKRRKQIAPIQRKARKRQELLDKERVAGLTHKIEDEILKGEDHEAGYSVPEEALKSFEDADKILEEQESSRKKKSKTFRDPNFFISHYAPAGDIQDKQLQITSGFTNDAAQAAYDLNDDDKVQVHKQTATVKWDKKRKKYVNMQGIDNKKYIIGESGQKIPASFKSGKFAEWSKSRNIKGIKTGARETSIPTNLLSDPTTDSGSQRGPGGRFKHKQNKAPRLPDKFRDDYQSQKKKVQSAIERGVSVKGFGGSSGNTELKTTAQIRKERMAKEKKRQKNARPTKKRKF
ncbi:hypothetical protein Kpol_1032p11 [Vanderwaltozyma polyspora DSM 70294]|uniref:ATP-dependent RNA helicase DBP10 n=1 Tax=Vanderwaltozyma polyspora (strain ATCC 22028 / DSM 70294 / BCRC 21397 / CBS 2163 / NBRC 10782 / NRRL Y-8283 / UCD 57-17) TaxID=436907 RepID=DBP10_VANPO|nr:uncharacterized protein Kpol_1032p11 [Vanderwaltozyma polyspora DSM 70294]A7TGW7.1 RecName: Full=ATP-dependent RNA helicase DBP10 [Vanderwaltozyma polyspora DSM 70294]EDO18419.1 hypothetical protein Kpol_1032p11 [Vanderwaltozyma polyspora DSM 70294]